MGAWIILHTHLNDMFPTVFCTAFLEAEDRNVYAFHHPLLSVEGQVPQPERCLPSFVSVNFSGVFAGANLSMVPSLVQVPIPIGLQTVLDAIPLPKQIFGVRRTSEAPNSARRTNLALIRNQHLSGRIFYGRVCWATRSSESETWGLVLNRSP
jgi:hypothetical protein